MTLDRVFPVLIGLLAAVVLVLAAGFSALALAAPADNQPCKAKLPTRGATFAGRARLVIDGDTLCIGPGADQRTWIPVRLADFYAPEFSETGGPEATLALIRLTRRSWITCGPAQHRSFGRIVAVCTVRGVSIADHLRRAGVPEGGRGR